MTDWRMLWAEHSARPAPDVDFSRSIVAGVFLGSRPTAGYRVDITAATLADGRIVLEYVEQRPAPGGLVLQVLTSPYHLVTLSRDVETVEFRRVVDPPE